SVDSVEPLRKKTIATAGVKRGRHPYGVRPLGNYWTEGMPDKGLGLRAFATLADDVLVHSVLFVLDAVTLSRLSRCSRAWYVYSHAYTDVWKALVLGKLAEG
ncbi:histone arginine, partial [Nannochloropsis gaditana CCMP526]|uniref:histone arginine n=1 Tax=Nannochloropsis gaditana (strain CCMP526) TaxID=1093141 RepID=UPI00029F7C9B